MIKKRKSEVLKTKKAGLFSEKKKPFIQPDIKVYKKLEDITLFTSVSNVSGGTFF